MNEIARAGLTVSVVVMVWLMPPLVPVIVSVEVLVGVLAVVVTVSVQELLVKGLSEAGLQLAPAPLGRPLTPRRDGAVEAAACRHRDRVGGGVVSGAGRDRLAGDEGDTASEKGRCWTARVVVMVWLMLLLVPVSVSGGAGRGAGGGGDGEGAGAVGRAERGRVAAGAGAAR